MAATAYDEDGEPLYDEDGEPLYDEDEEPLYDEDGQPVIWVYDPLDVTIIAVGPDHYTDFPCGTVLEVCGPGGCIEGERKDSCPGCGINHLDLSRLGHLLVCGEDSGVCEVTIRKLN